MTAVARLPPDPRLPGLAVALDRDALLAELGRRLPECRDGAEPVDAQVVDVQYRPGETATLLVKVKLSAPGGGTLRQHLYFQALQPGAAPPAIDERSLAAYRSRREQRGGRRLLPLSEPVQHWADLSLAVHAFPVDPRLPSLAEVLDPEAVRVALHRAWQPRGVRVRRVTPKLMSYTPESRAALRYEVLSEDKRTGLPELRRLVGKVQRRKHPAVLFTGHWAVWKATFGRVSLAPPVGYVATSGLTLQEFLEARRLSDLAGKGSFLKGVKAAARAIAVVNGEVLALPGLRDPAKECRTVERWVKVLSKLRPGQAERLDRHGARLKGELESRFRARGTVHSDFHLANVMTSPQGVTLIDWDQVAHGDPALDPARFLGALRIASLRVTGEPNGLAEAAEAFLSTYLSTSGEDERQVRLFESLALMIASASPFRLQRAGWEEHADLLIEESERMLDRATSGPALAAAPPSPRPLPLEQRREWSLDPVHAQSLLVPLLQEREGEDLEVTECAPSVLGESEELLQVRWSLKGWKGDERWREDLAGLGLAGHTGTALLRRLGEAAPALESSGEALRLPRPLGHLAATSILVVERLKGRGLLRRLGTEEERSFLERLGRAAGALSRVRVELDKVRDADREAAAVARRVERLHEDGVETAGELGELLERARQAAAAGPPPSAPTPAGVALSDLVFDDERVGLKVLRDLVAAPPAALAANLLSQLRLCVLRGEASDGALDLLRSSFLEASGAEAAPLAGLETILLLRRASRRLLSKPGDARAAELTRAAAALLDGGS